MMARHLGGGVLHFSDAVAALHARLRSLMRTVAAPPAVASHGFGRQGSLLLGGAHGSGRTAVAAQLAWASDFAAVHVLSADEMRGAPEGERILRLQRMMAEARKAASSVVVR